MYSLKNLHQFPGAIFLVSIVISDFVISEIFFYHFNTFFPSLKNTGNLMNKYRKYIEKPFGLKTTLQGVYCKNDLDDPT